MDPLQLVKLTRLMSRSSGRPEVVIGLIDGPLATWRSNRSKSYRERDRCLRNRFKVKALPGSYAGRVALPS